MPLAKGHQFPAQIDRAVPVESTCKPGSLELCRVKVDVLFAQPVRKVFGVHHDVEVAAPLRHHRLGRLRSLRRIAGLVSSGRKTEDGRRRTEDGGTVRLASHHPSPPSGTPLARRKNECLHSDGQSRRHKGVNDGAGSIGCRPAGRLWSSRCSVGPDLPTPDRLPALVQPALA